VISGATWLEREFRENERALALAPQGIRLRLCRTVVELRKQEKNVDIYF
jgi:hypothetical protein